MAYAFGVRHERLRRAAKDGDALTAEANRDAEQLRLLSIFHYIVAGMQALFACFPFIHFLIGTAMVFFPDTMRDAKGGGPPAVVGMFFMAFAGTWILVGLTLAACTMMAGRSLAQRRRYTFCLVIAGVDAITCMMRPSVKQAFGVA